MRILFAFTGGRGHVEPLLPLAEAARAAGHTVAFGGRQSILPVVERRGFDAHATEPRMKPPQRIPLQPLDPEREARDFREGFVVRSGERAPRVEVLCREWRPDVLVAEETHYGALIAAERLGLPLASLVVLAAGTLAARELVAEPLNEVRAEHGLPSDDDASMLSRQLVLAPLPPTYRDPAFPLPPATTYFRPFERATAARNGAVVYVTLGTVFNLESGDLFTRVLAGVSELPVEVVATVGDGIDPAELEPLPDNIRVERFVPQAEILPLSSVVVSHGGSGSVLGALAHGLPQVLIPMGADQPLNAARCAQLGLARVLDPVDATPADIGAAVSAVLNDSAYRAAASALQAEYAALPGPEHAVRLLEELR